MFILTIKLNIGKYQQARQKVITYQLYDTCNDMLFYRTLGSVSVAKAGEVSSITVGPTSGVTYSSVDGSYTCNSFSQQAVVSLSPRNFSG